MAEWFKENLEWVFSGIGVFVLTGVIGWIKGWFKQKEKVVVNTTINNNPPVEAKISQPRALTEERLSFLKRKTVILFIDDDTKYKVVKILKDSGWSLTKVVKDVKFIDEEAVRNAHIFFVDIQGVGVAMDCKDEGLGLAKILKKRYPDKKVIIYSAEEEGNRFHPGLRAADYFLPKNAEPYEFLELIEQYSDEMIS